MKRIGVLILILFLLPMVSSVEFNLKEEFKQGETLLTKISGNFLQPISSENILFYKNGYIRTAFDFDLIKINQDFYLYASLTGKDPGNYSLSIEGATYMKASQAVDDPLVKDFVINNQTADFSISPAVISTNQDFFINAQNLQDHKINVQIKIDSEPDSGGGFFDSLFGESGNTEETVEIISGDIKKINFQVGELNESKLKTVTLETNDTSYDIPVYLFTNDSKEIIEKKDFRFEPSNFNIDLAINSSATAVIYLYNEGNSDLKNITLSVSSFLKQYIDLSLTKITTFDENSSIKLELYISSSNTSEDKVIEGHIQAREDTGLYAYSTLSLTLLKDFVPFNQTINVNESQITYNFSQTCEQLKGNICSEDQLCKDNRISYATDGNCCLTTCEKKEGGGSGKIIGWAIIIFVIILIVLFFKFKYGRSRAQKRFFKMATGRKSF